MGALRTEIYRYDRIDSIRSESGCHAIKPTLEQLKNSIILGDCNKALSAIPANSISCIVTSPPYYQQRDYEQQEQLGAEKTPEDYVVKLRAVFRQCHRVLRNDGLLWLNLGDKYSDGRLLGLPWRAALALADDGWILRSDIVWHKPNAMPSSVTSRPTTDHEYLFLFSKGDRYRYFADAIREPHVTFSQHSKMRGGRGHFGKKGGTPEQGKNGGNANLHKGRWDQAFHPLGRNKRTVWSIPLSKFRGAHFAVFPEKLVETCVLAASAGHDVILDPFCGSGTTLVVARRLGRSFIGIEANAAYCSMAQGRLDQEPLDFFPRSAAPTPSPRRTPSSRRPAG
ncbi:MAG TPA: site-specific DNA-methyltransferase [Steroidobacteraceae bacterium]